MPASYIRYLENFMRRRYKLVGTPVVIETRAGANPFAGKSVALYFRKAAA